MRLEASAAASVLIKMLQSHGKRRALLETQASTTEEEEKKVEEAAGKTTRFHSEALTTCLNKIIRVYFSNVSFSVQPR